MSVPPRNRTAVSNPTLPQPKKQPKNVSPEMKNMLDSLAPALTSRLVTISRDTMTNQANEFIAKCGVPTMTNTAAQYNLPANIEIPSVPIDTPSNGVPYDQNNPDHIRQPDGTFVIRTLVYDFGLTHDDLTVYSAAIALLDWLFTTDKAPSDTTIARHLLTLPFVNGHSVCRNFVLLDKGLEPKHASLRFDKTANIFSLCEIVKALCGVVIRRVMKNATNAERYFDRLKKYLANNFGCSLEERVVVNSKRSLSYETIRSIFQVYQLYGLTKNIPNSDSLNFSFLQLGDSAGFQLLTGINKLSEKYMLKVKVVLQALASGNYTVEVNAVLELLKSYTQHVKTFCRIDDPAHVVKHFYPMASIEQGSTSQHKVLADVIAAVLSNDPESALLARGGIPSNVTRAKIMAIQETLRSLSAETGIIQPKYMTKLTLLEKTIESRPGYQDMKKPDDDDDGASVISEFIPDDQEPAEEIPDVDTEEDMTKYS